jgi:hypothetical protein
MSEPRRQKSSVSAQSAALCVLALLLGGCGNNRGDPLGDASTPAPLEPADSGPSDGGGEVAFHSDGNCAIFVSGAVTAVFEECDDALEVYSADGGSFLFSLVATAQVTLADGGAASVGLGVTASGSGPFSPGAFASGGGAALDIALDQTDHATFYDLWSASFDPESPAGSTGAASLLLLSRGAVDYSGPLPGSPLAGGTVTLYSEMQGSLEALTGPLQAMTRAGYRSGSDAGVSISGSF